MERKEQGNETRVKYSGILGVWRQDREFWKLIDKHDFICLSEIWVEEKGWKSLRNRLPNTHIWDYSQAIRIKKRDKASAGFIIGLRKDWDETGSELIQERQDGNNVKN